MTTTRTAAHNALDACLNLDNHTTRQALDHLDEQQLEHVEAAAVALSLHASVLHRERTELT